MIFSFQFFFTRRNPSLLSCENYLSFRQHKGGLGIPDLKAEVSQQYAASKLIIAPHVAAICTRSTFMPVGEQTVEGLKRQQQSLKTTAAAVTLEEQDVILNKQQFRDALRFRYNLPLADLPSHCACADRFTFSHSLSCKKGGFAAQRHDGIRNLLTSLLSKVCKDVEVEPHLLPINNEVFDLRSTVTNPEARLDMKSGRNIDLGTIENSYCPTANLMSISGRALQA